MRALLIIVFNLFLIVGLAFSLVLGVSVFEESFFRGLEDAFVKDFIMGEASSLLDQISLSNVKDACALGFSNAIEYLKESGYKLNFNTYYLEKNEGYICGEIESGRINSDSQVRELLLRTLVKEQNNELRQRYVEGIKAYLIPLAIILLILFVVSIALYSKDLGKGLIVYSIIAHILFASPYLLKGQIQEKALSYSSVLQNISNTVEFVVGYGLFILLMASIISLLINMAMFVASYIESKHKFLEAISRIRK